MGEAGEGSDEESEGRKGGGGRKEKKRVWKEKWVWEEWFFVLKKTPAPSPMKWERVGVRVFSCFFVDERAT